jgi:hypothetical protein
MNLKEFIENIINDYDNGLISDKDLIEYIIEIYNRS